jgi:hypothetical protein
MESVPKGLKPAIPTPPTGRWHHLFRCQKVTTSREGRGGKVMSFLGGLPAILG